MIRDVAAGKPYFALLHIAQLQSMLQQALAHSLAPDQDDVGTRIEQCTTNIGAYRTTA